jgi:AraC-like DNA-binding protein
MKRKDAEQILEIKAWLDEHLFTNHSIQELCRRFNINRDKLQTGFHEVVQSTVHAYMVRQRLERAARRLIESDDSIKAISFESGYKKQRSFNKNRI